MSMQYYATEQLGFIITLDELVKTINLKLKQVLPEITENIVTEDDIRVNVAECYNYGEFDQYLIDYLKNYELLTNDQIDRLSNSSDLEFLENIEITDDSYVENVDILLLDSNLQFPNVPLEIIYWIPSGSFYASLTSDGISSPQEAYDAVKSVFGDVVTEDTIKERTGITTVISFG